jgi:hypothetical protein
MAAAGLYATRQLLHTPTESQNYLRATCFTYRSRNQSDSRRRKTMENFFSRVKVTSRDGRNSALGSEKEVIQNIDHHRVLVWL